ncbi:MAG: V-type ATP synthase subunit D [Thermoprotei archaeon]|nr:MAG: V-type ATP synthase subunit D [Thermoprotei archaeon]RLF22083.1 MAG: V-type ATP synthase subunit D [Thermoprotei archaeon]
MELLNLRRRKRLAERGLSLLKEKRDALVMELLSIAKEYQNLMFEVREKMEKALSLLSLAKIDMGVAKLNEVISSLKPSIAVEVRMRNIMGVATPMFKVVPIVDVETPPYNLVNTSSRLDEAANAFRELFSSVVKLAEVQAVARRIAEEVEKAKRRVNALENVVIPTLNRNMKYIELYLDERAREDVFRLRLLKKKRVQR